MLREKGRQEKPHLSTVAGKCGTASPRVRKLRHRTCACRVGMLNLSSCRSRRPSNDPFRDDFNISNSTSIDSSTVFIRVVVHLILFKFFFCRDRARVGVIVLSSSAPHRYFASRPGYNSYAECTAALELRRRSRHLLWLRPSCMYDQQPCPTCTSCTCHDPQICPDNSASRTLHRANNHVPVDIVLTKAILISRRP